MAEIVEPGITVTGTFSEEAEVQAASDETSASNAVTSYDVPTVLSWSLSTTKESSEIHLRIEMQLSRVYTKYFKDAKPKDKHDVHGTLGEHEGMHRSMARKWWTQRKIAALVDQYGLALVLKVKRRIDKPEAKLRATRQSDAITSFLTRLHDHEQAVELDRGRRHDGTTTSAPVFTGTKR